MSSPQDGVICLDKAAGITSATAIAQIKRKLNLKKIGHAGTLDPMATGILVCLCGSYTKRASEFQGGKKTYEGLIQLGITTDTDDLDGETLTQNEVPAVSEAQLQTIATMFSGEINQVPPQVSAIKKDGKRAYELARAGKHVTLEARVVTIYASKFTLIEPHLIQYLVTCSTGTYIRSIARDIGEFLECGAAIRTLRRVASEPFLIDQAVTFDNITENTVCPL